VNDIRDPLAEYAVFVCPILSGSGVRVKLLKRFPRHSSRFDTSRRRRTGRRGWLYLRAGRRSTAFADHVLDLLRHPEKAAEMAARARANVVATRDMRSMTERLVECYRSEVARLRTEASSTAFEYLAEMIGNARRNAARFLRRRALGNFFIAPQNVTRLAIHQKIRAARALTASHAREGLRRLVVLWSGYGSE